jgi:hypothetical protein
MNNICNNLCIINKSEKIITTSSNDYQDFFYHKDVITESFDTVIKNWFDVLKKEDKPKSENENFLAPLDSGIFVIDMNNKKIFTNISEAHSFFIQIYKYELSSLNSKSKKLAYYTANNLISFENQKKEIKTAYEFFNDSFNEFANKKLNKIEYEKLTNYCLSSLNKMTHSDVWVIVPSNFSYELNFYQTNANVNELDKLVLDLYNTGIYLSKEEKNAWLNYAKNSSSFRATKNIDYFEQVLNSLDEIEIIEKSLNKIKKPFDTKPLKI